MKISKNFVIGFLVCFMAVIIGNIAALTLDFFANWMIYLDLAFAIVLFFLIFRKHKTGFIRTLAWLLPLVLILGN